MRGPGAYSLSATTFAALPKSSRTIRSSVAHRHNICNALDSVNRIIYLRFFLIDSFGVSGWCLAIVSIAFSKATSDLSAPSSLAVSLNLFSCSASALGFFGNSFRPLNEIPDKLTACHGHRATRYRCAPHRPDLRPRG